MSDSIQFMDLKTQYQRLAEPIRARMDAVLDHGRYIMGPEVAELERELAAFCGVKHAISCASGTDALLMPLMAYGIGPGDAVFTTTFTFIATAEVISLLGATPVFVDIDPQTYNMDPNKTEEAILRVKREGKLKPRGLIPVDLFGLPADYGALEAIAARYDLFVIEDTAQGLGGRYKGRVAGSFGDLAATSFYPAKPLGAYGDGGALFTDDDEMARKLISIREHGQGLDRYHNVRIGINGRLDSLQAAVLLVKLSVFEEELAARQRVAEWYQAKLDGVTTPFIPEGYRSSWALYSVLHERRDALREALSQAGVPTVVYYVIPLHLQDVFEPMGYRRGDLPVSERVSSQIFSLPMHPYLTEAQVDRIAAAIASFGR